MAKLSIDDNFPAVKLQDIDGVGVEFRRRSLMRPPPWCFFIAAVGDPGAGPR